MRIWTGQMFYVMQDNLLYWMEDLRPLLQRYLFWYFQELSRSKPPPPFLFFLIKVTLYSHQKAHQQKTDEVGFTAPRGCLHQKYSRLHHGVESKTGLTIVSLPPGDKYRVFDLANLLLFFSIASLCLLPSDMPK